jgi:hypothetical protein
MSVLRDVGVVVMVVVHPSSPSFFPLQTHPPSLPPPPQTPFLLPPLLLCNFIVFILFPVSRGNIHTYIHKCIK